MQDNPRSDQDITPSGAADPQALMLEDRSITEFLDRLSELGEQLFTNGAAVPCGLMSRRGNQRVSVRSSSETATALNEMQHDVGEGPSLAAMTTHEVIVVDDARHDSRWPQYFSSSAVTGYASMLSVPLNLGSEGVGTLNFYARPAGYFTAERQRTAAVFATQASHALEMAMRVARHQDVASDMYSAMESRTSIDVAVGIIIGQNRCTQDQAIAILKRASNNQQRKLRDVARDLIVQTTGTTPTTHFTA